MDDLVAQELLSEINISGGEVNNYRVIQGNLKWNGRYYVDTGKI